VVERDIITQSPPWGSNGSKGKKPRRALLTNAEKSNCSGKGLRGIEGQPWATLANAAVDGQRLGEVVN